MQTTACNRRRRAYRQSRITATLSTATIDKLITKQSPPFPCCYRPGYRTSYRLVSLNERRALRRDHRARRAHFAHGSAPSRTSTAHAHSGPTRQPSKRDLNGLITSPHPFWCRRSFRICGETARRSPDTIGTGERRSLAGHPEMSLLGVEGCPVIGAVPCCASQSCSLCRASFLGSRAISVDGAFQGEDQAWSI